MILFTPSAYPYAGHSTRASAGEFGFAAARVLENVPRVPVDQLRRASRRHDARGRKSRSARSSVATTRGHEAAELSAGTGTSARGTLANHNESAAPSA